VAALLENADQTLQRLITESDAHRAHYDASVGRKQLLDELDVLKAVYAYDPNNENLARRIARLSIGLADWDGAIRFLEDFLSAKSPQSAKSARPAALLTCLGLAYCRQYPDDRNAKGYAKGRGYLEQAVQAASRPEGGQPHERLEAMTLLGDAWMEIDDQQALRWYREAFESDPSDPRAVAGYLALKVAEEKNVALASMPSFSSSLKGAVGRLSEHVEIGIHLPEALFQLGQLQVLKNEPYQSLTAYCEALRSATEEYRLDDALRLLRKLRVVGESLPHVEWNVRLLELAKAARFHREDLPEEFVKLSSEGDWKISPPVVIVAGGCDARFEQEMSKYRDLLVAAFEGFQGTIISGGTTAGISGLVGELAKVYPGRLRLIGYIPELRPSNVLVDTRYKHLLATKGKDFSAVEPIQNWIDLVISRIDPAEVKLLGIN
jgi:tetratricopeptide (TPR) repeat protein